METLSRYASARSTNQNPSASAQWLSAATNQQSQRFHR